mmetsp:Transcript_59971/g.106711  ORF Transcript_59971/g.106711 Transcript_59971/m.106711 type:complete len:335 (+) Transcript_59971:805-1809(+)
MSGVCICAIVKSSALSILVTVLCASFEAVFPAFTVSCGRHALPSFAPKFCFQAGSGGSGACGGCRAGQRHAAQLVRVCSSYLGASLQCAVTGGMEETLRGNLTLTKAFRLGGEIRDSISIANRKVQHLTRCKDRFHTGCTTCVLADILLRASTHQSWQLLSLQHGLLPHLRSGVLRSVQLLRFLVDGLGAELAIRNAFGWAECALLVKTAGIEHPTLLCTDEFKMSRILFHGVIEGSACVILITACCASLKAAVCAFTVSCAGLALTSSTLEFSFQAESGLSGGNSYSGGWAGQGHAAQLELSSSSHLGTSLQFAVTRGMKASFCHNLTLTEAV